MIYKSETTGYRLTARQAANASKAATRCTRWKVVSCDGNSLRIEARDFRSGYVLATGLDSSWAHVHLNDQVLTRQSGASLQSVIMQAAWMWQKNSASCVGE